MTIIDAQKEIIQFMVLFELERISDDDINFLLEEKYKEVDNIQGDAEDLGKIKESVASIVKEEKAIMMAALENMEKENLLKRVKFPGQAKSFIYVPVTNFLLEKRNVPISLSTIITVNTLLNNVFETMGQEAVVEDLTDFQEIHLLALAKALEECIDERTKEKEDGVIF